MIENVLYLGASFGPFFLLSKHTIYTLVVSFIPQVSLDDHGSYFMTRLKNLSSTQSLGPSPFLPRPHEAWYTSMSSTKLIASISQGLTSYW